MWVKTHVLKPMVGLTGEILCYSLLAQVRARAADQKISDSPEVFRSR